MKTYTVEELFNIENDSTTKVYLKKDVDKVLARSITWSIDDFELKAREKECIGMKYPNLGISVPKRLQKYDRTKFADILYNMIRNHDAELGITWTTIECYLDNYCYKGE